MDTPVSLLQRLRQPDQADAWPRFVELYTPLLFYWARRTGLQEPDAADLVQDVFTTLIRKLPDFRYDPVRGFRSWLRTVLLNKWRESHRRRTVPLQPDGEAALHEVPDPDPITPFEEAEFRRCLVVRALRLMQAEFEDTTWRACWEHVVSGRPAVEVAAELGVTVNAVYLAKCRVLRRLRQELQGLLD